MPELDDFLGSIYHADQVTHDHQKVKALIDEAKTNDPTFEKQLRAKLADLQVIRTRRSKGNVCGCHVTATLCRILERHLI